MTRQPHPLHLDPHEGEPVRLAPRISTEGLRARIQAPMADLGPSEAESVAQALMELARWMRAEGGRG